MAKPTTKTRDSLPSSVFSLPKLSASEKAQLDRKANRITTGKGLQNMMRKKV